ncbi:MAG: hypothetical protein QXM22_02955 [Candidatus Bathyarchaeia archaeon]
MGTVDAEDGWSFRVFVLFLFPSILFIGIAAVYYIVERSNWAQLDPTLAASLKIFYIYAALLGICVFAALVWLVVDERKIRHLTRLLKANKN